MSLTGVWRNSYGSIMDLVQDPATGDVQGIYSSNTGSTGRYHVRGWATTQPPSPASGAAASLCIYWRSIVDGEADPSWHWVSGLGGQLSITDTGEQTLSLMHAMVATEKFPDLAEPGVYLDKLLYSRVAKPSSLQAMSDRPGRVVEDAINGDWMCLEMPDVEMSLQVTNPESGAVCGIVVVNGNRYKAHGFTDTYAAFADLRRQSLCLAFQSGEGKAMVLSGSLDYGSHTLSVMVFESGGTENGALYLTTMTRSWTFRPMRR